MTERIIDFHFVLFALMAVSPLSVASADLVRSAGLIRRTSFSIEYFAPNFRCPGEFRWLSIFETR
jgi:hypothetical protein